MLQHLYFQVESLFTPLCLAFNMRVIIKTDFNNKDIGPNKFDSKKLDFRILLES